MGYRKCWGTASWLVFVSVSWLSCAQPLVMAQETVKLTEQLIAPVVKPWRNVHSPTRNLVELVLPTSARRGAPITARVAISTEVRSDHSAALKRLQEIAAERDGEIRHIAVCGWPALDRRVVIELPQVVATQERGSRDFQPGRVKTTVVTVAVAADDSIARYEGTLLPDVPVVVAEQIVGLARALQCSAQPPAGQTQRELQMLENTPLKLELTLGPATSPPAEPDNQADSLGLGGPPPLASSLAVPGTGELQIAVSDDGQNVLVAAGGATTVSTDGGLTFPTVAKGTWPGVVSFNGDPSVGVGATRDFYIAFLGVISNGCTASVGGSVDGGKNFNLRGHAAICPGTGNMCFPDQEQMAVDRKNKAAGSDQLYMVWRNFSNLNPGLLRGCQNIHGGSSTPLISCSQDSGLSWDRQTAVGTGDFGRITVGGDGSVYVTYVSGANLMINKFSQCALGLKQDPNFPRPIANMRGVFCPVPGLDRCTNEIEASPQPAVDDTDPQHVLVAYADNDGNPNPNENVILLDSRDGGLNWTGRIIMNSPVPARRFLPWVCVTQGIAYVTWYDRPSSDLTAYFLNTATGAQLKKGSITDVSQVYDPQCKSGWLACCSADSMSDIIGCPAGTPPIPGVCRNFTGGGSKQACTSSAPACPNLESCQAGRGGPKYGDYNGNACINGGAYVAWASGTPPPGVAGAPAAGINVYTSRLNYPACGGQNQACCFQGQPCHDASLGCNSNNICSTCGDFAQPCCAQGAQCHNDLVCAQKQCQCGFSGQPCCGPNKTCQAGLSCDINSECVCGGLNQPCCNQSAGGTCNDISLACDHRDFLCRPTCGSSGQQCCNGTTCSAGLVCAGGVCACGGQDQPCCAPNGTCNFGLKCAAGSCRPGASNCGQCGQNFASCLNRCGNDAACQCLCRNDQCDCFQQNSCGTQCIMEDCSRQ